MSGFWVLGGNRGNHQKQAGMERLLVSVAANCELTWWVHLHGGGEGNEEVGGVVTAQLPQLHGDKYLSMHFPSQQISASEECPCRPVDLKLCERLHPPHEKEVVVYFNKR